MEDNKKIVLPKELQKRMIEFFLKTSIPRKKQEQIDLLSETESDGSERHEEKHKSGGSAHRDLRSG